MKRKLSGSTTVAISFFVTSGILASALGVRQIERMTTSQAVVVSQHVAAGQQLSAAHFKVAQIDDTQIKGTLQDPKLLIGKVLTVSKLSGDLIYPNEVQPAKRASLSQVVPEGKVLFTLKQPQSGLPFSKLHNGDRFDILVKGRNAVRTVATNVQLIGIIRAQQAPASQQSKTSQLTQTGSAASSALSMVMAVDPDDVYPLASIGHNEVVSIVLHSAYDVANGTQPLSGMVSTYRNVAVYAGTKHKTVRVKR